MTSQVAHQHQAEARRNLTIKGERDEKGGGWGEDLWSFLGHSPFQPDSLLLSLLGRGGGGHTKNDAHGEREKINGEGGGVGGRGGRMLTTQPE